MTSQLRRKHLITARIHLVIPTRRRGRRALLLLLAVGLGFTPFGADAQTTISTDSGPSGTYAIDPAATISHYSAFTYASSKPNPAPVRESSGGGFGGYLPAPTILPPSQSSSRWMKTAKSVQEKMDTAKRLPQRLGSAMKSQFKTSGDSLKSAFQSVAGTEAQRSALRSVLANPLGQPSRRLPVRSPGRMDMRATVSAGNNRVRTVSYQEPVENEAAQAELLNFEFSESNELPLESPRSNRTAAIPADWTGPAKSVVTTEQPPSVFVPENRSAVKLAGDAPLPPDWELQDEDRGAEVELDLASPLPPSQESVNQKLKGNRDRQRRQELEGDMELRLLDSEQFEQDGLPLQDQSCAAFRDKLLNNPITDIALDLSPPGSSRAGQGLKRVWTNRNGEVLANGTLVDLSRGYATVKTDEGLKRLAVARLNDADWSAIAQQWRIPVDCSVGGAAAV
ncbi:MAG: hypothetical protein VYE64_06735, partial [Planctomycetota bacterium]|nr:hypothetical protein [Planctomycetota bacterium]